MSAPSWPLLLRHVWVTAAGWGAVLLCVAAIDLAALRRGLLRRRGEDVTRRRRLDTSEHARASPHLVLYTCLHPSRSGLGVAIELCAVVGGLTQYVVYLWLTYKSAWNPTATALTILLSSFFWVRFLLRLAMTDPGRRLAWALHLDRVCDVWATWGSVQPFLAYTPTFWTFAFLRIVNVYYALQALEPWLEPTFLVSKVQRFVLRIVLLLGAYLAVMAAVVATLERVGNPADWGSVVTPLDGFTSVNALYWALITCTTVGYGDITPLTLLGRIMTSVFLVGGIILVGFCTARLLELISGQRHGRGQFINPSRKASLLITGEVDGEALVSFLHEIFHPERVGARGGLHAVVLSDPSSYSSDTATYLRTHPLFTNTVTYLCGTVFDGADVKRTGADRGECQAAFVLQQPYATHDTPNLLRTLALRRRLPQLPLYVMLAHSDNVAFLRAAGVSDDSILSMDLVKSGLMAANVVTPGVAPLLINLCSVSTGLTAEQVARVQEQWKGTQPAATGKEDHRHTPLARSAAPVRRVVEPRGTATSATLHFAEKLLAGVESVERREDGGPAPPHWQAEYGSGLGQELYEVRCPQWLVGLTLMDAVILVYCAKIFRDTAKDTEVPGPPLLLQPPPFLPAGAACSPSNDFVSMARRFLESADEGPVLISVRHVKHLSGAVVMHCDLASPAVLRAGDSLFIAAQDLAVLGTDIAAAGRRIIHAPPRGGHRAPSLGTPSLQRAKCPTADGSGGAGGEDEGIRFTRSLKLFGAVNGASAAAPVLPPAREESGPPTPPRPDPTCSQPTRETSQQEGKAPPLHLHDSGRALAVPCTHGAAPSHLSGHIVILAGEGETLLSLHHFLYALRWVSSQPVVVVAMTEQAVWDETMEDLKFRLCYMETEGDVVGAGRAAHASASPPVHSDRVRAERRPPHVGAPLFFVRGSPLQGTVLVKAGLLHAQRCVIFAGGSGQGPSSTRNVRPRMSAAGKAMDDRGSLHGDRISADAVSILSTLLIENSLSGIAPSLLHGTTTEISRDGSAALLGPAWELATPPTHVHTLKRRAHTAPEEWGPVEHKPLLRAHSMRVPALRPPASIPGAEGGAGAPLGLNTPARRRASTAGSASRASCSEEEEEDEGGDVARVELSLRGGEPMESRRSLRGGVRERAISPPPSSKEGGAESSSPATVPDAQGAAEAGDMQPERQPLEVDEPAAGGGRSRPWPVLPTTTGRRLPPSSAIAAAEATHAAYREAWRESQDRVQFAAERGDAVPGQETDVLAGMGAGSRWSPRYAAGRLMPSSCLLSMLAQAFYNPSLLRLVRHFARGDGIRVRHREVPLDLLHSRACPHWRSSEGHGGRNSADSLHGDMNTPSPRRWAVQGGLCDCSVPYAHVFLHLLVRSRVVPLGIFRDRSWAGAALPYVQCNPPAQSRVRAGDVLFVVVSVGGCASPPGGG